MRKKLLSLLFVSMLLLSACGDTGEPETTEEPETEEIAQKEKYKVYSINDLEYSIPESWTEGTSDKNLKYYYPEAGMLMVNYTELDETISNGVIRETFIKGFTSEFDSFDLISESEITVGGTTAYQYNMNIVLPDKEFRASVVIFDYYDGIITLFMTTLSHSDKDYSSEFENILSSIEFTGEEVNEVVEESAGNEIVLGEPIELGEYTLTIQEYSLGLDYKGNNALIIEYDWVNNSEKSTSPFMTFVLKGFQGDVETDNTFMVEGVDLGIGQKEVRPGGIIEGAQATVGISDITKLLELELDELFSFDSNPYIAEIDLSTLE